MKQRTLRDARGKLTQEQLEQLSGVAQATISKIERGEVSNPSHDTVKALELALKLRPGTLVFGQAMEKAS